MSLSKRTIEMLLDLVEIKLSYMDISDREDARDLQVLERCREELNAVERGVDGAAERFGRVDLHHLNAGIPGSPAPFEELTLEDFDRVLAVNLRGVFLGLRAAFRQFARQPAGGSIVVTASIGSLRGSSDLIPYHASKHGVVGLMRCAAVHGADRGVRVNAVCPGWVKTEMDHTDQAGGNYSDQDIIDRVPMARFASPEDIARAITMAKRSNP